jgi:hypothetical protein
MAADDKNKKGGPKKTSGRKKKTDMFGLSGVDAEQVVLPEKQRLQVEEVIKQAFLRFYDNAALKKHRVKDLEHLDSVVSEFLNTFMVLGYDMTGEKVFIMHAKSPHDRDALVEHLRTTLLGIISPQG